MEEEINEVPYYYICEYLSDVEDFAYWMDIHKTKELEQLKDWVKEYKKDN